MIELYIDADACPVKEEIYQVASRYGIYVWVVANSRISIPREGGVEMIVVADGPDVADDWIAEHIQKNDIAVTGDIPLAARCLEKGAHVIGTHGQAFDQESIGLALAHRELNQQLRESGSLMGGPAPLSQRDRSRFLSGLDSAVQKSLRASDGQA
ncbi:MAG: hypothetical protein CL917_05790 [Deltaproteobacteria bacterium]|nr:hypothetical protein [Deltaproteobacteria bacterium]